MPAVYDPQRYDKIDGESSNAGKLGSAAILNQNPIFEMDSNNSLTLIVRRSCQEMSRMKRKKELSLWLLSALVLISTLVFIDNVLSNPENPNWSKVVFFVS